MKLLTRFKTVSRRSIAIMGAGLMLFSVAAVALPKFTQAANGSDREIKAYTEGMAGFDHVQFNSFTGVPNIGDERQFFTGMYDGANTPFYDTLSGAKSGDTMLVRVYVHNNADSSLNASGAGVAKNTKVRVALPTGMATTQTATAFVSADNAQPQIVEDNFSITADSAVNMSYVPGSATIKTNYQDKALSDDIVTNGVLVGDNNTNGDMPGCFDHVALVTFKVKLTAPGYSLDKKVRLHGTSTFTEQVTAKAGDKVDFALAFKNNGSTTLNQVVLGDRLPVGLKYDSSIVAEWNSSLTGNKWTPVSNNDWIKGGINIGNYAAGAAGYVRFTAIVDDASKLQCGLNRITNVGFAKPADQGTIEDSAEVDVTKECQEETPTPVYSCDLLEITKDDASKTVTIKTMNTTAKNGATLKSVELNWGENGVNNLTTNTPVGQTHTYAGNGPFTITATPTFTVNGKDVKAPTNANCAKQVSFTTPTTPETPVTPETPTELPNTGAGDLVSIFAAVVVLGAAMHRLFLSRRLTR